MNKKTVNFKTKIYLEHLNETQTENKNVIKNLKQQLYYIKIIKQAISEAKHEGRYQNYSCCPCSFTHTHNTEQSKHGEHNKNEK